MQQDPGDERQYCGNPVQGIPLVVNESQTQKDRDDAGQNERGTSRRQVGNDGVGKLLCSGFGLVHSSVSWKDCIKSDDSQCKE